MFGPVAYWIGCFVLGGVPFALLIGKAKGVDIRTVGSRNTGATNLGRALGLGWGVAAFVLDAAKGLGAVYGGVALLESGAIVAKPNPLVFGAAAAILGHCYSVFLRLRGGKGVATAAGALLALHPVICAVLLGCWVVVVGVSRTVGVGSCAAAVVACVIGADLWLRLSWLPIEGERAVGGFLFVLGGLLLFKHRKNIREYMTPRTAGGTG